jgi:GNAT superfamily N-acetyltransferase
MNPEIVRGYVPGAIGRVAELHGTYYSLNWGFGLFFEAKVATELAAFLSRPEGACDGFWAVAQAGRIEGSIAIDGSRAHDEDHAAAHLRWFIVSDALRGTGLGRRLLDAAVGFCRGRGYPRITLWTFEGLDAARYLYESAGFQLAEQRRGAQWGVEVNEQRFELRLG